MKNKDKTPHKNIHREYNKYIVNIMRNGKIYRKSFLADM